MVSQVRSKNLARTDPTIEFKAGRRQAVNPKRVYFAGQWNKKGEIAVFANKVKGLGYALAYGKEVIIIGPIETIFCTLADEIYATEEDCLIGLEYAA